MIQPALDVVIFFARNALLAFVLFYMLWRAGSGRRPLRWIESWSPPRSRQAAARLCLALLLVFAAVGAWYIPQGGFAGEVEPVVSCLAWLSQTGHPLYNAFDAAERYSVLYGPSVFLTNGLFLRVLGPSLASAKVASILGAVGSLVFVYAATARKRRDLLALTTVTAAAMFYWAQGFAVYLVRPDALMVFAVGFALFAAVRLRPALAVLAVAAAAGFAVNLKIHGVLYFVPVFAVLAGRLGRRATLWAGLVAAAVTALPFALSPLISLRNYVAWLVNAAHHGLTTEFLGLMLGYAAFLLLPLVVLSALRGWREVWTGPHRALLVTTVVSLALTLVLAAKPGAGMVHLLPLVPVVAFATGRLLDGLPAYAGARSRGGRAALAALALTALLAGSVNGYRAVRYVDWHLGETPDLAGDIRGIMAQYPGLPMAMACGGENAAFRATWLRPLLVFQDNPVLVDPISVMDSALSGRELSPETYAALSDGRIGLWLVPRRQVPFRKVNWYAPHNPVFPDEFVRHFQRCYTVRGQSRYFDLWFWNGLDPAGDAAALATHEARQKELLKN